MAKYGVRFGQVKWTTVFVELDDEEIAELDDYDINELAIEQAYADYPAESAHEVGWGSFGKWTADFDEAMTEDEFFRVWSAPDAFDDGIKVVERVDDEDY